MQLWERKHWEGRASVDPREHCLPSLAQREGSERVETRDHPWERLLLGQQDLPGQQGGDSERRGSGAALQAVSACLSLRGRQGSAKGKCGGYSLAKVAVGYPGRPEEPGTPQRPPEQQTRHCEGPREAPAPETLPTASRGRRDEPRQVQTALPLLPELTIYLKGAAADWKRQIVIRKFTFFSTNNGIRDMRTKGNEQQNTSEFSGPSEARCVNLNPLCIPKKLKALRRPAGSPQPSPRAHILSRPAMWATPVLLPAPGVASARTWKFPLCTL